MKSRLGGEPTQTPPKPTSSPLMKLSVSVKTFLVSKVPLLLVSSEMRRRSRPDGFQGAPGPV